MLIRTVLSDTVEPVVSSTSSSISLFPYIKIYGCLHGFALRYLAELCTGRRHHGAPQSALHHSLRSTELIGASYDRRAFSYAGPHAWNSLPEHLRQTT